MVEKTIIIPQGYKLVQTKKNVYELELEHIVDFSILNEKDWFYFELYPLFNGLPKIGLVKGNILEGDCKSWFKNSGGFYSEGNFCEKKDFKTLRLATKEEIEELYKLKPEWKEDFKWEDFGSVKGYYINSFSSISRIFSEPSNADNKNTWPTKEEAEACLALSQLCHWRDKYNEGWKPDWSDVSDKFKICYFDNTISIEQGTTIRRVLSFKTKEIANNFRQNFKDLIEIAKPLL